MTTTIKLHKISLNEARQFLMVDAHKLTYKAGIGWTPSWKRAKWLECLAIVAQHIETTKALHLMSHVKAKGQGTFTIVRPAPKALRVA